MITTDTKVMHVQPWPLANRSTARCWVRERACLRLMLFSIPGPRTSYATTRCAVRLAGVWGRLDRRRANFALTEFSEVRYKF
jgi:hypothetical protein